MSNPIGLRTFKTGIAVGLSLIISQLLHLRFPFFVCMTSIFTMDKTAMTSLHMGKIRVFGTLLGAMLGTLFASIDRFNPILCAMGVILLITILNYLKMPQAIGISGIVFCACMVHVDTNIMTPLYYGAHRTLDSFVGMIVSLSVNLLILPNYDITKIQKQIDRLLEKISSNFEYETFDDASLIAIHSSIKTIQDQIKLYDSEYLKAAKRASLDRSKVQFSYVEQMNFELQILKTIKKSEDPVIYQFHYTRAHLTYQALVSL